jgi:hypothetical protein
MNWFFVGVDLGQSMDPSAIAVVERAVRTGTWDPVACAWPKVASLELRYLERIKLGTPYPEVVERVMQVTRSPDLYGRCHLAVDGTGAGRPVVDLFRMARPNCVLMPASITCGGRETQVDGYYHLPKRDLIVQLQVLFQYQALRIAAGLPHAATLLSEMQNMRVKVTSAGNEQYGAWREGQHDDLVFAVALACWAAKKVYPNPPIGDHRYWRNAHYQEAERVFRDWFTTEAQRTQRRQ